METYSVRYIKSLCARMHLCKRTKYPRPGYEVTVLTDRDKDVILVNNAGKFELRYQYHNKAYGSTMYFRTACIKTEFSETWVYTCLSAKGLAEKYSVGYDYIDVISSGIKSIEGIIYSVFTCTVYRGKFASKLTVCLEVI